MAVVPNGNNRPALGLIDEHEREPRNQIHRVLEIQNHLTELFNVPENERDLQWSTNTLKSLVDYVPILQMVQAGGIPLRDMPLHVMRRILNDGDDYEEMIHGDNAIFPLMDIVYFVIENIDLWLAANPIEDPVNDQLQNAEGEEILEIPDDNHNEGANVRYTISQKIVHFGVFIIFARWVASQIF